MAEFSFLIKVLVEHQVTISIPAASEDAAHELAWDRLPELKDLSGNPAVTSKVLSRSVLPAAAAEQQAAPPPRPTMPSMAHYGRLMLTGAVNTWMHSEPAIQVQREMHLRQCLDRHLSGEDGASHPDDAQLNAHTRRHPTDGGRVMSIWKHPAHPVLWICTDNYASPEAVTTILFPDDY